MATAQIYADLKRDHDKQRDMLKQLAELKGDSSERQKLFDELHKLMLADAPLIFLYNQVDTAVVSKRLQGFAAWVAGKPRLWEVGLAN